MKGKFRVGTGDLRIPKARKTGYLRNLIYLGKPAFWGTWYIWGNRLSEEPDISGETGYLRNLIYLGKPAIWGTWYIWGNRLFEEPGNLEIRDQETLETYKVLVDMFSKSVVSSRIPGSPADSCCCRQYTVVAGSILWLPSAYRGCRQYTVVAGSILWLPAVYSGCRQYTVVAGRIQWLPAVYSGCRFKHPFQIF